MNTFLLIFGTAWMGLFFLFEAVDTWNIIQAADSFWAGWARVREVWGPWNYPHLLFAALIGSPGILALGWRHARLEKASGSE